MCASVLFSMSLQVGNVICICFMLFWEIREEKIDHWKNIEMEIKRKAGFRSLQAAMENFPENNIRFSSNCYFAEQGRESFSRTPVVISRVIKIVLQPLFLFAAFLAPIVRSFQPRTNSVMQDLKMLSLIVSRNSTLSNVCKKRKKSRHPKNRQNLLNSCAQKFCKFWRTPPLLKSKSLQNFPRE